MSDNTEKSQQRQVNELAEFVAQESVLSKNAIRNQFIMMAVLALILVGYFAFLNSQLRKLTEPDNLAKEGVIFLEVNSPDIAKLLEVVLLDKAPKIADFMKDQVLTEGVPFLVDRSEDLLNSYVNSLSQMTADYMDQAFAEVVKQNVDSIREAAKAGVQGEDWPANALQPMRDQLRAAYKKQTAGHPSEAMNDINKSLIALQNLNKRLITLATKDPSDMTRQEQLGARLLTIYWQYTHSTSLSAAETKQIPGQGKYAGEGSMDPNNLE